MSTGRLRSRREQEPRPFIGRDADHTPKRPLEGPPPAPGRQYSVAVPHRSATDGSSTPDEGTGLGALPPAASGEVREHPGGARGAAPGSPVGTSHRIVARPSGQRPRPRTPVRWQQSLLLPWTARAVSPRPRPLQVWRGTRSATLCVRYPQPRRLPPARADVPSRRPPPPEWRPTRPRRATLSSSALRHLTPSAVAIVDGVAPAAAAAALPLPSFHSMMPSRGSPPSHPPRRAPDGDTDAAERGGLRPS